jgi:hypothetical protein
MHKVNKKRTILAVLFVPLMTLFVMFNFSIVLLLLDASSGNHDLFNQILMASFYGLYVCYPVMLLVGLPIIIMIERNRPNKIKAFRLYFYIAILASVVPVILLDIVSFVMNSNLSNEIGLMSIVYLSIAGGLSGSLTAFIMLWRRKDWYESCSVDEVLKQHY